MSVCPEDETENSRLDDLGTEPSEPEPIRQMTEVSPTRKRVEEFDKSRIVARY